MATAVIHSGHSCVLYSIAVIAAVNAAAACRRAAGVAQPPLPLGCLEKELDALRVLDDVFWQDFPFDIVPKMTITPPVTHRDINQGTPLGAGQ